MTDTKDESVQYAKLHLFLVSGKTFTFHAVADFEASENMVRFTYKAKSDDWVKVGHFPTSNLAGWSFIE